jgi:uncharacterized protein (TIGR03435 family)
MDNQAEPMPEWFSKISAASVEGKVLATMEGKGVGAITGRRVTMAQLAESLTRVLRVFVRDETALAGKYYFAFRFAPENAAADSDLPPLTAALQENVGLKLEKRKGPVETLVVDHVEKTPTQN